MDLCNFDFDSKSHGKSKSEGLRTVFFRITFSCAACSKNMLLKEFNGYDLRKKNLSALLWQSITKGICQRLFETLLKNVLNLNVDIF
jgi:hypothetical protein